MTDATTTDTTTADTTTTDAEAPTTTTTIRSNGSRFLGEKPASLDELLRLLATHELAPMMCRVSSSHDAVRFAGNFAALSHVFDVETDDPEIAAAFWRAFARLPVLRDMASPRHAADDEPGVNPVRR